MVDGPACVSALKLVCALVSASRNITTALVSKHTLCLRANYCLLIHAVSIFIHAVSIFIPWCACASEAYGSVCVCVCVCLIEVYTKGIGVGRDCQSHTLPIKWKASNKNIYTMVGIQPSFIILSIIT